MSSKLKDPSFVHHGMPSRKAGLPERRSLKWFAVLILLGLFLVACGSNDTPEGDEPLKKATLISPVGASVVYSPWYIARELKFFEEEGYDVTFEPGDGSSQAVQLVLANQGDISTPGVESLFVGAATGEDIRSYFQWATDPVFGLIVAEDSPIQEVSDLEGKTLGVTALEAGEVPVAVAILQDAGLVFGEDVAVVPVGAEMPAILQALDSGRIDALAGSVIDFAGLGASGFKFRRITTPAAQSFPGGLVFVARGESVEQDSEMLIGVTRAIVKATHALIHVPEVGEVATRAQLPEAWDDPDTARLLIDAFSEILELPEGEDIYGMANLEGWQLYADYLSSPVPQGEPILQGDIDVSAVVTNELVQAINDFDREAVEEIARNYVEEAQE